jgi:ankyrin repeat protein
VIIYSTNKRESASIKNDHPILNLIPIEMIELRRKINEVLSTNDSDLNEIDQLLVHRLNSITSPSQRHKLSLLSAELGLLETLKELLTVEPQVSINSIDPQQNKYTLLMIATQENQLDIVEMLLKQGALKDIQARHSGLTAYDIAVQNNNHELIALLRPQPSYLMKNQRLILALNGWKKKLF